MKTKLIAVLLLLATPSFAHRLDEYLQAIMVSLDQSHMNAQMRLIPGVTVSTEVISEVDTNHDGTLSPTEQHLYAQKVLNDLTITIDGHPLKPTLETVAFPTPTEMKDGLGEIHIDFSALLAAGSSQRSLVIENHHDPRISVYLMNVLVPQDRTLQVTGQERNQNQSYYRITYNTQSTTAITPSPFGNIPSMFRLGMRHIAEGTDHLLFLLTLLIAITPTVKQIIRIVTAFTLGHSLTLALGAWGIVSLPSRLVEVLIALSILISAIHALRPIFPGREPLIAAFFGLIHGLAFATTLQNLGITPWQRLASILGFNLGIETMQLIVVAAILPSLLILSRLPIYKFFRLTGASFAALASLCWIAERLLNLNTPVDPIAHALAHQSPYLAALLLIFSLISKRRHCEVASDQSQPTNQEWQQCPRLPSQAQTFPDSF